MRPSSHFEFRDSRNAGVARSLGAAFVGSRLPGPSEGPPRARRAFAGGAGAGPPRRRLGARLRGRGGPRRSGGLPVSLRSPPGRPPGPRRSSRRALRRSRFRCPSGFPFSLPPSSYLHSIDRHPPCQAPAVCPSPHFQPLYDTVGYRTVRQRGPRFSCAHVTYPGGAYVDETVAYRRVTSLPGKLRLRTRKLHPSKLPRGNIRHRNINRT